MNSIIKFHNEPFIDALKAFFAELKVPVIYWDDKPASAESVLEQKFKETNEAHQLIADVYAFGMVDDAVFKQNEAFNSLFGQIETFSSLAQVKNLTKDYDGLLIFGVILHQRKDNLPITRSQLAEITRAFNRAFPHTPVTIIFKYNGFISFANSERISYKQEWREGEKIGKVIIVQNIDMLNTHSGHKRILLDLTKPNNAKSYKEVLNHWNEVLDVSILNKKFFTDLSNWYFWAMESVSFPDDLEKKKDVRNATNLIRLITRVVFIWFIKEKSLVSDNLFNKAFLATILKDFNQNKTSQNYYNAILQNLFFGTLNQRIEERKFSKEGDINTNKVHFGVKNLFRYADLFNISEDDTMQLFKNVPFLNGGLFDCLDKPNEEGKMIYVDGFSRNKKKQASVPDDIFFGDEREVNLNDVYATKNKKYKVKGLINLLESYKFTVEENTPLEEEVALDPELLGKVFENLLASYNPETQTTARKQTGSFYTPREIVNYMVDESLLEYIKQNCLSKNAPNFEPRLRDLLSYAQTPNPFDEKETKIIIEAINNAKILDPACGSGAYPMGVLQKMVHLLRKLDPQNKHWRALQQQKAMEETDATFQLVDKQERAKRLAEINDVFENNASDYGRKLYLIENCIYGIDIQPIAVQISKLRFFISLIIDQNKQPNNENFGIRSLPNLETKFVAANTLIGLNKPAQTLLRNPTIEEKEAELKEIRHKYFTASTRTEKLQYQKQDKKLRQEIASLLEKDGWNTIVAKQIVAFDPYDQNVSASWFDPEWMFGLATGFDIVIGNPPYGVSIKGDYRKQIITQLDKVPDYEIYYYFFEIAKKLVKTNGIKSFIVPNTFLFNVFAANYRKKLLENWDVKIIDCTSFKVFEGATVYNAITFFKNSNCQNFVEYKVTKDADNFEKLILNPDCKISKTAILVSNQNWALVFKLDKVVSDLIIKVKKDSIPLIDLFPEMSQGLIAYDKYKGQSDEVIKNRIFHFSSNIKPNLKPYLWGEDVKRYEVNWNKKEWLDYGNGIANPRQPHFFQGKRILIREITNPSVFCAITDLELYHDPAIIVIKDSKFNVDFLCAILNSKLASFFHFNSSPKASKGAFPKILVEDIKNFPIKLAEDQKPFIDLVDEIISLKKVGKNTLALEHQVDIMVYHLYGLSFAEAQVIDAKLCVEDFE